VQHVPDAEEIALGVGPHLGRVGCELLADRAKHATVFVHHRQSALQRGDVVIEQMTQHA
jgi:hypothetical protein